jgi:hypothetical protein
MAQPVMMPIDVDQSWWALAAHAVVDESSQDCHLSRLRVNRFKEL